MPMPSPSLMFLRHCIDATPCWLLDNIIIIPSICSIMPPLMSFCRFFNFTRLDLICRWADVNYFLLHAIDTITPFAFIIILRPRWSFAWFDIGHHFYVTIDVITNNAVTSLLVITWLIGQYQIGLLGLSMLPLHCFHRDFPLAYSIISIAIIDFITTGSTLPSSSVNTPLIPSIFDINNEYLWLFDASVIDIDWSLLTSRWAIYYHHFINID